MISKQPTIPIQETAAYFVLAPVQMAIEKFNDINVDADCGDLEIGALEEGDNIYWFGIGESPYSNEDEVFGEYPYTFRLPGIWVRVFSQVHRRLLVGIFATLCYLFIYLMIFRKLFKDIFIKDNSKCRETLAQTWLCNVALVRRIFGIMALVLYLGTIAFTLRHFHRLNSVMQIEMDIMELQDFKMDVEALDNDTLRAGDETSGLLDEVKARLQKRVNIVREFKKKRKHDDLADYKDLAHRLANATEELQETARRNRNSIDEEGKKTGSPAETRSVRNASLRVNGRRQRGGHSQRSGGWCNPCLELCQSNS